MDEQEDKVVGPIARVFFGAVSGTSLGAVSAAAIFVISKAIEGFTQFVLSGCFVGCLAGIGWVSGFRKSESTGAANFSLFGFVLGLLPAVAIVYAVISALVQPQLLLAGGAGCMFGLILGGILDRAFDDARESRWFAALVTVAVSIGISVWLVAAMGSFGYGPAPDEIRANIRGSIEDDLNTGDAQRPYNVEELELERDGRLTYRGFVAISTGETTERYSLKVRDENNGLISWEIGDELK